MNFKDLRSLNVNDHVEKKNGLTYLSWTYAVDELLQRDPAATWVYPEEKRYHVKQTRYTKDKQAYEVEGDTIMVFCSVNAFGKVMTAQLPVMDNRNQPIVNPDAFEVNKAMQRCLAKAIALHGIGLYIYSGEDLPEATVEDYIARMKEAKTIDILKSIFAEAWNIYSGEDRDKLKAVYDAKKAELTTNEEPKQ